MISRPHFPCLRSLFTPLQRWRYQVTVLIPLIHTTYAAIVFVFFSKDIIWDAHTLHGYSTTPCLLLTCTNSKTVVLRLCFKYECLGLGRKKQGVRERHLGMAWCCLQRSLIDLRMLVHTSPSLLTLQHGLASRAIAPLGFSFGLVFRLTLFIVLSDSSVSSDSGRS